MAAPVRGHFLVNFTLPGDGRRGYSRGVRLAHRNELCCPGAFPRSDQEGGEPDPAGTFAPRMT